MLSDGTMYINLYIKLYINSQEPSGNIFMNGIA